MGKLSHTKYYLCGQIENDPAYAAWRCEIAKQLISIDDSIIVWDPMVKPEWQSSDVKSAFDKQTLYIEYYGKPYHNRQHCLDINIEARRVCRGLAGGCDILIARLSNKFTWGSIDEIEVAMTRRIPIFIWLPDGPLGIYGLPGITNDANMIPEYIHYNQESLINKLRSIHDGSCDLPTRDPERWLFLTYPNAART